MFTKLLKVTELILELMLINFSLIVKQAIFADVNHAWIRSSWDQPVLSNEGKVYCSRKQRGPLMGLEPTTSTWRVRRATHCATTPLIGSRKGFERDFTIELKINRGPYRRLAWISNKHSRQTKIQKPKIAKTWLTLNKYHARGSITVRDTLF